MRTNQPQTIYLSEYRVPAYLVDHVDLRFELFEEGARVHSTLAIRRNPDATAVEEPLYLHGDSLTLESVALDGTQLEAGDFENRGDALIVPAVPEQLPCRW